MLKLILNRYSVKNLKCEEFKGRYPRLSINLKYKLNLKYRNNTPKYSSYLISNYSQSRLYSQEYNDKHVNDKEEEEEEYNGEEIPLLQYKWNAIEEEVKDLLTKDLNPSFLRIMDKTKPGASKLSIHIEIISESFKNKSRVEKHKMVHYSLRSLMKYIHSITLKADSPEE